VSKTAPSSSTLRLTIRSKKSFALSPARCLSHSSWVSTWEKLELGATVIYANYASFFNLLQNIWKKHIRKACGTTPGKRNFDQSLYSTSETTGRQSNRVLRLSGSRGIFTSPGFSCTSSHPPVRCCGNQTSHAPVSQLYNARICFQKPVSCGKTLSVERALRQVHGRAQSSSICIPRSSQSHFKSRHPCLQAT
jgi:hypothetical protein